MIKNFSLAALVSALLLSAVQTLSWAEQNETPALSGDDLFQNDEEASLYLKHGGAAKRLTNRGIGGAVCQSLYDFRFVYDFFALSSAARGEGPYGPTIGEIGDKKSGARLLFLLCGRPSLRPDPREIKEPIANYDAESCR